MNRIFSTFTGVFIVVSCMIFTNVVWSAPEKKLWPRWQKHRQDSHLRVDYQPYHTFLSNNVFRSKEEFNQIHYSKVSVEDKSVLDHFIRNLSKIHIDDYNKNEQLAYWINLYNALTIKLILDNWPVSSIIKLNISPGWFRFGPWDAKLISVEGVALSLNDIEHRIIRPIWHDSRTHYALNCASYSCPQIQSRPFEGKTIDRMLDGASAEYVNSVRGVSMRSDALLLSSIYQWYGVDFGHTDDDVLHRIAIYAKPKLKRALLANTLPIKYKYNWQLNGD